MENYLDLLIRSFDSELTAKERKELNNALAMSESLRLEKEKLSALRQVISGSAVKQFRPFFVDRVMSRISNFKTKEDILFESILSVFRPIAVTAIMLLIVLLTYNINTNNTISLNAALNTPTVSIEDAFDPYTALAVEK